MTDSDRPPDSRETPAPGLRATPASATEKPEPKSPPGTERLGGGAARMATSPPAGAGLASPKGQRPPNAPAALAAAAGAPRIPPARAREEGGIRKPAPNPRFVVSAGEPYPPLSDRLVNGIAEAPIAPKHPESNPIAPRSPRAALEPDRVDMPTRRSRRARHPFVIAGNAVITLFLVFVVAASYALYVGKQRFEAPGPLLQDRVVAIARGSGVRDIADELMRDNVIDQPWVFIGAVLLLHAREGLKAGEYQFKARASLRDVVSTIADGKVMMHEIGLPEGLTSEQIVARLMGNDVLTGNIEEIPPEGSMLPDTYNFARGTTREQIIQRMQQAQRRLVNDIWTRRAPDLPLKTPEQLVVLASLVEKETGKPDERTRVAAVFVNRLKQKMRLQSDPTIIYGLVGGKGALGRPITKSEIDQPTPYNTYQIDGLPPGPITNPGRASLEAAANPARTRDLYFVADGAGGHVFAETYEQHRKNVLHLRQLEASQKTQGPSNAADSQAPAPGPAQAAPAPPAKHRPSRRGSNGGIQPHEAD